MTECECLGTGLRVTKSPDGRETYFGPGPCQVCCTTCRGLGWVVENQSMYWPYGEQVQCPDCS